MVLDYRLKNMKEVLKEKVVEILRCYVVPSIGCTEPIAVALACARGHKEGGEEIEKIQVTLDINTMKNALYVGIPMFGSGGLKFAAVLGALIGKPERGLAVLGELKAEDVMRAKELVSQGKVEIHVDESKRGLFIEADIYSKECHVRTRIEGIHTNFTLVEVNGIVLYRNEDRVWAEESSLELLGRFGISDLVQVIEEIDDSALQFLLKGFMMLEKAVHEGLSAGSWQSYGAALKYLVSRQEISEDILNKARISAAAAGDARMSGMAVPVMASFGSGNQGIVIYSSLGAMVSNRNVPKEKLARAVAIAHLFLGVTRCYTGLLTPYCGCALGAGAAATVGAAYLLDGTIQEMDNAFRLFLSNLAGIICDGAKESCAHKISTSAASAIENAYLACVSKIIPKESGIIGRDFRETLENIKVLTDKGMSNVDSTVLRILHERDPDYFVIDKLNTSTSK